MNDFPYYLLPEYIRRMSDDRAHFDKRQTPLQAGQRYVPRGRTYGQGPGFTLPQGALGILLAALDPSGRSLNGYMEGLKFGWDREKARGVSPYGSNYDPGFDDGYDD